MTTIASRNAEDDSHRRPGPSASALAATSAENWDDDFEFQGDDAHSPEHLPDAIHAPSPSTNNEEHEESWDDAYADDDAPSSPIRRADGAVHADDEEVEDWDSSDNEAEHRNLAGQEFGLDRFEEEDKTVTAKSNSRRSRASPPPPLPPFHTLPSTAHNLQPMHNAPPPFPAASPTLSTFSIPLSSQRDHASIYSQDPLLRSSSGSAPHLTIMRSYPHAAGSTPPRRSRRLKKKSRPPEADIFELEDREPEFPQSRVDLTTKRSSNHLALPPSTPPPDIQQTPAPTSSPASSPSLLTRIGSFKRWARRSIGPEDPSFSGWRRARSSTGPADMRAPKSSQGPKSSTSPEDVLMEEITQNMSVAPAPTAPSSKTRKRGASAGGLKSGWFFRSGGTAGSGSHHNQEVTPVPPSLSHPPPSTQAETSLLSTPQKKGGLSPLKKRGASGKTKEKEKEKEMAEADERDGLTPTPRKARGKLVPILRGKAKSSEKVDETSSGTPISMTHQGGGPSTQVFPRHAASMGRHSGIVMAPTASGTNGITKPPEQESGKENEKEKSSGMRSLINGVRRISLVGQGHKRSKNGSMDAAPARCSHEVDTNSKHRESTSTDILDLNSPTYLAGRRGSLPWLDHSPPIQNVRLYERHSHEGMERFSFGGPPNGYVPPPSPTSHPKHPAGSPPRPKPLRLTSATTPSTSPSPVPPPSPSAFRTTTLRPESAASNHRSDGISSRVPSSSSGSRTSDSRPRTPNHGNRPRTPTRTTSSTQQRPVTPLAQRPVSPLTQRPPPIVTSPNGQHTPITHAFAGQSASLGRTTSPHAASSLGRMGALPPTGASLGRSSSQSSHSGLKRNSLNDLKRTPSILGDHKPVLTTLGENKALDERTPSSEQRHRSLEERKASVNTLSELKIPARISRAQQGLRRDLGMVREFAGCVEQLKKLQATYRKLIGELCVVYESYPVARPPSRPPSQMAARSTSRLTSNPNPSVQSVSQCPTVQISTSVSPVSPPATSRSVSRASTDLHRELARLEHDYGLWWECAELLVDLGGGSTAAAAAGSVSNPNLSHHSSSSALNISPEAVSSAISGRFPAHVPSKSDPGLLLLDTQSSSGKSPPQASQMQWRASTGRHDLSARQLKLLKDMLNTPDPASLADSAGIYGYGLGPDGFIYPGTGGQPWGHWNASNVTLPSEESSADINDTVDLAKEARKKEKKRRVSKLGILGLRDLLLGLKKKAVAEGRLPQRSESSLGSNADDDFYNRRRSPWHQHDAHHVREVPEPILVPMPAHPPPPKSPRRPSLASIFRIGYKNSKNTGKKDATPPSATNRSSTTEDDQDVRGDYGDWEKMSRSDLDLSAVPSGTATVRGRKNAKGPPSSFSNTNLAKHPYGYGDAATTPRKNAVASRTSLREVSSTTETDGTHPSAGTARPGKHRTASWSQAASPSSRPSSRNGRAPISGTVRSAPPADLSPPEPKLALTPENIKPLLEYAKEVSSRLTDCISEVEGLLGVGGQAP